MERLRDITETSVHCVVTSPPYWGLREYNGEPGMIGMEPTFDQHLENLVAVFREVWRVLRDDGVLVVNYGDAYAGGGRGDGSKGSKQRTNKGSLIAPTRVPAGLKSKDLMMMPSRVAMALQADGWYLRSMIPWIKANPLPESVTDRPSSAVEYFFLFAKSSKYFWNHMAVRTQMKETSIQRLSQPTFDQQTGGPKDSGDGNRSPRKVLENIKDKQRGHSRRHDGFNDRWDAMTKDEQQASGANMRNYIIAGTVPFRGAHWAVFPSKVIEPFIKAGCPDGGTVLDPFGGAGTTALVADRLGRDAVLVEISPEYAQMSKERIEADAGMFASVEVQ